MADLRNRSRNFASMGNQKLLDAGLNAFGLELFVESLWDAIERDLERGAEVKPLEFLYRGMSVVIDPTTGLEEDRTNFAAKLMAFERERR